MRIDTHKSSIPSRGHSRAGESSYLRSTLRPEPLGALGEMARPYLEVCSQQQLSELDGLLYPDVFSEYDARFLSAHFAQIGPLSADFRQCEALWAADEELHYLGFRSLYAALVGESEESIDARMEQRREQVDFEPLRGLLEDELTIACLMAYDELATVAAYRANLKRYAWLGPEGLAFVREVTSDEGRHYRNFRDLIRRVHGQRLDEVPQLVARIRAVEGVSYAATFVLDHEGDVWNEAIFDEAAATLCRALAP